MSNTETISVPVWIKRGGMLVRRDCLDYDDPDHTYNWFIKNYPDLVPSAYGLNNPLHERFKDYSRDKLMQKIIDLEKEIISLSMYG